MFRWVDHTAELELHIEARSESEILAEALRALGDLIGESKAGEPARHEITADAPDRPALLAEWLGELLFLAETDAFVPERIATLELAGTSLRATVEGRRGDPRPLVKAVTYHDLEFRPDGDLWRARVVLDV